MSTQIPATPDWMQVYRPSFFESLAGITSIANNRVLLCDRDRGLLTEVDLITQTETLRKYYDVYDYADVNSIGYFDGRLYSVFQDRVYVADYHAEDKHLRTELFLTVPDCSSLTGIAVTAEHIYLVTQNQSILAYHRSNQEIEEIGRSPGVGTYDLCYFTHALLIVDAKEQTVYVFDLETRKVINEILAPFENPTGIAAVYHEQAGKDLIYLAYSRPGFEIYDAGESEFKLKLRTYHKINDQKQPFTDNFIYPLVFKHDESQNITRSNGFLIEMYYVEKLHPLPEIANEYEFIQNLEWKISMPLNTDRQELIALEPIGPFQMRIEEIPTEENRKVAVFSIPEIDLKTQRTVFGWKALVKVFGIRYAEAVDRVRLITDEERDRYAQYLQNEAGLDMDRRFVQAAAEAAVQDLSEADRANALKKAIAIREYIYAHLTYVMDQYHDGAEDVLKSGEGSCGEYLNVFLALLRLNEIPARAAGDYKVPAYKMQAGSRSVFLSPDFNHVWLQFYAPGLGWLPLESSSDDEAASFRRWSKRYFLALAWYHLECRIGSYFEDIFEKESDRRFFLSPGELGKNDIRFKVIRELDPGENC
jgi:hypothetical protein